ncbi:hypothetical protein [Streptomyces sp. XD-27]|uniref:hypothetical protein n=1 Tax=Streptomyces sp. XD-27 TaxID=3062779 RepID=UPI0026F4431C|nr:hypothetical protein [Streptomyces sp. XD-27]WKX71638.1 hypothetical protein Q3Y56_18475 [Streptomyces sp. XD-27]
MSLRPVVRAGVGLRVLRAAVFTAACVALAAGGHVLASCAPVPLWTLAAGGLGVFAVVVALAGRERSLPGIAAALALGQLALHTLFGLGQQGSAMAQAPGAGGSEGRVIALAARLLCDSAPGRLDATRAHRIVTHAGIDPAAHGAQVGPGTAGHAAHEAYPSLLETLPPSPSMVLGHLLAALAAGWLLRRGEVALWRAVRLSAAGMGVRALRAALRLVRVLRTGLLGAAPLTGVRAARADRRDEPGPTRTVALQHSVIRRGPPRYGLAA